ncbi:MAG: amino acid ABC transporter permease [Alphaproteobacteria bacterium]|nr:amino acid ABC transporter permease [Alphaproteobacteria bacterium]
MSLDTATLPTRPSAWNDPRVRGIVVQVVVLAAVVAFGIHIVDNTATNLAKQKIASGFGFLSNTAGFDISMHLIPYTPESTYGRAFVVGLVNTLLVAAIGVVLATVVGFVMGVARLSPNFIISRLAGVYIEIVRNVPLLLQLFFWYFATLAAMPHPKQSHDLGAGFFLNVRGLYMPSPVPGERFGLVIVAFIVGIVATFVVKRWARRRFEATGQPFPMAWAGFGLILGLPIVVLLATGVPLSFELPELKGFNFTGGTVLPPEFAALLAGLSVYTAAFIAENVRSGIQAVSHGQTEAAFALGLRRGATLRLIVIPQALRVIIPPLTSQYLNLTKNSSLAVAIGYPDLVSVFAGTVLNQTGQAVEVILITMAIYLTISLLISLGMNLYNRRVRLVER